MSKTGKKKEISDVNDDDIENAIDLLNYYHNAMNARRDIELKIFIAAISFFVAFAKGLYDSINEFCNIDNISLIIILFDISFFISLYDYKN